MSEFSTHESPSDVSLVTKQYQMRLPLSVKAVAIYFLLCSTSTVVLTLFMPAKNYAELKGKPVLGRVVRAVTINILYLVCGVGLLRRRAWARKIGLFVLVVSTYFGTYGFGWGISGGRPNCTVLFISLFVIGTWNAFWFFLLYRQASARALS